MCPEVRRAQSEILGFRSIIRDGPYRKLKVQKPLNKWPRRCSVDFLERMMLERHADTAVLGLVSILYAIAVFFLKQRRA